MAQFDVYPNPNRITKAFYPYLVDIQSTILTDLATRIVIPLGKSSAFGGQAMQGLTPELTFDNQELLLLTPQISSISEKHLAILCLSIRRSFPSHDLQQLRIEFLLGSPFSR